jgi:twitching motility protein PilT
MLKISQAPKTPVQGLQKFSIAGTADPTYAGKHLILDIDRQLKVTGPPVSPEGLWQIGLSFQDPGHHQVAIALGAERVELGVQVLNADGELPPEEEPVPVPPPAPHRPGTPPPMPAVPKKASSGITLEQLVREAYEKNFSDVHLGVGKVPHFRNRGWMEPTTYPRVDEATFFTWLREILSEEEIREFQDTLDFDGGAQYPFARIRINIFNTLKGPAMVLRLIPLKISTLDELELPQVFRDICHANHGLILVTGPTGSGKSTTLAAMMHYINHETPKHIITIEDPIEFVHTDAKSVISQREVGMHTRQFSKALRAALREDPDVILIGEMRDRETMDIALKASQTGHLVLSTLHTNSAVKTIERILNFYDPDQQNVMRVQVAEALVAVTAQSLVRTTDGRRAPIHEIMVNTDTIKDYILRGDIGEIEAIIPDSGYYGMCSMNQSIYALFEAGRLTEETALEASPKPNELAIMLKGGIIKS